VSQPAGDQQTRDAVPAKTVADQRARDAVPAKTVADQRARDAVPAKTVGETVASARPVQPTEDPVVPAPTGSSLRSRFSARIGEIVLVGAVLIVAGVVRFVRLGSVPNVATADELDNLQTAYHIIEGTGPGLFGFDWKPAPSFSMYPLAWSVELFGDSVTAFRMMPVLTSLGALVMFYLVARRAMGVFAASAAMLLLATNLSFLHFSRTAWENNNAALFALGACYAIQRALGYPLVGRTNTGNPISASSTRVGSDTKESHKWWVIAGVFTALGLYGYFTGRFIFVAVVIIAAGAVITRQAELRLVVTGLVMAGAVSAVLFFPMAVSILGNWDVFTSRTSVVSVFGVPLDQPYEGESNGWTIATRNLLRNYEGLILQDGSEWNRGLWARYNPVDRAPLGFVTKHLFWAGLLTSIVLWKKTYMWWAFFVPVFVVQVFSLGTPDLARGVLIVPFYFLFIGLLFHELKNVVDSKRAQMFVVGAVIVFTAWTGIAEVDNYFDWHAEPGAQSSRLPGVAVCEFDVWSGLARDAAKAGPGLIDNAAFDAERRELACSDVVNAWLPPPSDQADG